MTKAIFRVFGKRVREITSREETERPPENRLGRSRQAPACPRNRKPAGDLARQIEPLPSRSGRLLDYESSGSPSPSGFHPARASPTGRRIGGYDYKTESFQRPRVEPHAYFREIGKFVSHVLAYSGN